MTLNCLNKRLQEYFTAEGSTDIPKERSECQKPDEELIFGKRYSEEAIRQLEQCNKECDRLTADFFDTKPNNEGKLIDCCTEGK